MEQRIIVSGDNALRLFSVPELTPLGRIPLEGAGALCGVGGTVFCACEPGGAIWRLGGDDLVPTALFAGGPGVCDLALSPDGERLYALCADADSVLMLDARSGAPQLLMRAGQNPCRMALDASGRVLAVAGGAYSAAVLLCAHTLRMVSCVQMPGPVYDVAHGAQSLHALCLNESLASTLATASGGMIRAQLSLAGMPGALLARPDGLLAATQDHLYALAPDGVRLLRGRDGPGRAARMLLAQGRLLVCDALSDALFALGRRSGRWQLVCEHAHDVLLL